MTSDRRSCRRTEHLVFRHDPKRAPAVSYRSLPHGCSGAADTLDEARRLYRSAMTRLLGVSRHQLPPRVEHVEALVGGMWIRDTLGVVHRDERNDRMFLQTLLSPGAAQAGVRAHVGHLRGRGASPVVVLVEPEDTVGDVVDQLRGDDVLVIVHPDDPHLLGWVTLYGPDAVAAEQTECALDGSDLRMTPVASLTRDYAGQAIRVTLPA